MDQLDDFFGGVIEESGIDPVKLRRARLREEWEEIVGEDLSRHLTIHSLERGRLLLKASDPSWSQEASMMRNQIQSNVNKHFDSRLVTNVKIIS